MENRIQIMDAQGQCKAEKAAPEQVVLTWEGEYTPGDVILFEVSAPGHYVLRVDDCMDEATVYITGTTLRYPVLFEEKKNAQTPRHLPGRGTTCLCARLKAGSWATATWPATRQTSTMWQAAIPMPVPMWRPAARRCLLPATPLTERWQSVRMGVGRLRLGASICRTMPS